MELADGSRLYMEGILRLESKHGIFDGGTYDYRYDGVNGNAATLCEQLKKRC